MCQKCLDVAKSLFGELSQTDLNRLFVNATSYPAGDHEDIKQQLQGHYDNGARTVKEAIALANKEMMESLNG